MFRATFVLGFAALCWVTLASQVCGGCTFVVSEESLRDRYLAADSTVIASWKSAQPKDRKRGVKGQTNFTIVRVVRDSGKKSEKIQPDKELTLNRFEAGQVGDRFLMFGGVRPNGNHRWAPPVPCSETLLEYVTRAPDIQALPKVQLEYFVKYLDSPARLVAHDACLECYSVATVDLLANHELFPHDKLRQWIADPQTDPNQRGFYARLLGLRRDEADTHLLRELALQTPEGFRFGADGIFVGYLMNAGESGLAELEQTKFYNKKVPFSEVYAGLQALRFMWFYGSDRIPKDRLKQSMRGLLDRPELADLVIVDLGRWQDWSVADRLMEMYDTAGFDIPSTKRTIVRFFLTMEADKPKDAKEPFPAHVVTAQKHLKTLREKAPETVKAAEEFFFLGF